MSVCIIIKSIKIFRIRNFIHTTPDVAGIPVALTISLDDNRIYISNLARGYVESLTESADVILFGIHFIQFRYPIVKEDLKPHIWLKFEKEHKTVL